MTFSVNSDLAVKTQHVKEDNSSRRIDEHLLGQIAFLLTMCPQVTYP